MKHAEINWASSLETAEEGQVVLNSYYGFLLPHIVIGITKLEIRIKLMHELVNLSPSDAYYRVKKSNGLVIGSGDGFGCNRLFIKIKSDLNQDQTTQYVLTRMRKQLRLKLNQTFEKIDNELRNTKSKVSNDDIEIFLNAVTEFYAKF